MQWDPCQLCSPEHYDSRGAYHDIPGEQHMMRERVGGRVRDGEGGGEGGMEGGRWKERKEVKLVYHKVVFLPSFLATYDDSILLFQ